MQALMRFRAWFVEVSGDEPSITKTIRARCASYPAPTAAIPVSRPVPIPPP
jgi:hypothetical protein